MFLSSFFLLPTAERPLNLFYVLRLSLPRQICVSLAAAAAAKKKLQSSSYAFFERKFPH